LNDVPGIYSISVSKNFKPGGAVVT
jgi:hypothetical protein